MSSTAATIAVAIAPPDSSTDAAGRLRVGPESGPVELAAGDLVTFAADVPHLYEALETTRAVLLMSYP